MRLFLYCFFLFNIGSHSIRDPLTIRKLLLRPVRHWKLLMKYICQWFKSHFLSASLLFFHFLSFKIIFLFYTVFLTTYFIFYDNSFALLLSFTFYSVSFNCHWHTFSFIAFIHPRLKFVFFSFSSFLFLSFFVLYFFILFLLPQITFAQIF